MPAELGSQGMPSAGSQLSVSIGYAAVEQQIKKPENPVDESQQIHNTEEIRMTFNLQAVTSNLTLWVTPKKVTISSE